MSFQVGAIGLRGAGWPLLAAPAAKRGEVEAARSLRRQALATVEVLSGTPEERAF